MTGYAAPRKDVDLMHESVWQRAHGSAWYGDAQALVTPQLVDEQCFSALTGDDDDDELDQALHFSAIPRLRPVLIVLAARAAGGSQVEPELQYAAELLYGALLVHDLATGRRGGRRRRLARSLVMHGTSWARSQRMFLRSLELARQVKSPSVLGDAIETMRAFGDAAQLAEDLAAGATLDRRAWEEHADGHTAALFAFCCRAGGRVSGARPAEIAALGRYGRHLGRLWHAAEDVILLQQPDGATHLLSRAVAGRPMLPVAIALSRNPALEADWQALLESQALSDARAFLAQMLEVRALAGTRESVVREHWNARQAVLRLPDTPYRRALERLASGLSRAPFDDVESSGLSGHVWRK